MLMNVGPTHDGRIVPVFEERLLQLGILIIIIIIIISTICMIKDLG